jgi:hypothetical protein
LSSSDSAAAVEAETEQEARPAARMRLTRDAANMELIAIYLESISNRLINVEVGQGNLIKLVQSLIDKKWSEQ